MPDAEYHEVPICYECSTRVESNPVFAAPCGHADCPSAVFHGLCLMEFREKQQRARAEGVLEVVGLTVVRHSPGCPHV